jgi:hypothetical protein
MRPVRLQRWSEAKREFAEAVRPARRRDAVAGDALRPMREARGAQSDIVVHRRI